MTEIADELNAQGVRTVHGRVFKVNSLRHILKNKAYTGVYEYSDIMIEDGMPRLVSDELFEEVQKRFERNKHKAKTPSIEEDAPRYWLTGKLYCGECGATMHGMSGTSKTGKIHYYYACKNHRKHKCNLRNIPQLQLEVHVVWVLRQLLENSENLASLAVDVATYYKELNADNGYIDGLEAELENRKTAIKEAIETERLKQAIVDDGHSIQQYFDKYANADFDDTETRNTILEYFVDKIYVYDDRLVITWYYINNETVIDLDTLTEITDTKNADGDKGVESSTLKQSAPYMKSVENIAFSALF